MVAECRPPAATPEFLVIGHVTEDRVAGAVRGGGTASYAAAVAARLGLRTAIVTRAGADLCLPSELGRVMLHRVPAATTTVFEHVWYGRQRQQFLRRRAGTIAAEDVPRELHSIPVVLFGPVAGEIEPELIAAFPEALRGATLQGWLRTTDADDRVGPLDPATWEAERVLPLLDAAFLSDEDLNAPPAARAALLECWANQARLLAVTLGDRGADLCVGGRWQHIDVFPAHEVEGTGAGDAFAAAFMIRYHETANAAEAARFAACVASFVVEAHGIAGAPAREQVKSRLAAHPEVRLRPR